MSISLLFLVSIGAQLPSSDGPAYSWQQPSSPFSVPGANRYQLGIKVNNLDHGVVIQQVLPGSPAAQAGLQRDDTIINVDGSQVGYVKGKLRDVADECNRRIDTRGNVQLLVRNRVGQLANVNLNLVGGPGANPGFDDPIPGGGLDFGDGGAVPPNPWGTIPVSGRLVFKAANTLPRTAKVVVRFLELPGWGAEPVPIVQTAIANQGRLPAPYELVVRPSECQAGKRFALEAVITDRGQKLFQTQQPVPINVQEQTTGIDLTLVSVQNKPNSPNADQLVRWYRQYFGREPDPQGIQYWIGLADAGTSLQEIRATFLSGTEFYEKCQSNNQRWVTEVFVQTLERRPNQDEVSAWLRRLQSLRGNRMELVREFLRASGQWES